MVVDDLDMPRRAVAPDEADAPSVVDANAVLTPAIAPQSLQSIAGRRAQVVEPAGCIKRQKLHPRALLDRSWQAANGMASEDGSSVLVGEAPDHGPNVTNVDTFSQALQLWLPLLPTMLVPCTRRRAQAHDGSSAGWRVVSARSGAARIGSHVQRGNSRVSRH